MKKELEKKLSEDFPTLFRDRCLPPSKSLMGFGCECGEGWYNLIYEACTKIMETNPDPELRFLQIKEKFGRLVIYPSGGDAKIASILNEISLKSAVTCEDCGSKGKLRSKNTWLRTLCVPCMRKRGGYKVIK